MSQRISVRRQFTAAERAQLLASYRQGGLAQRKFAANHHISVSCLQNWLRTAAAAADRSTGAPAALIELPHILTASRASAAGFKILFPGGCAVEAPPGFRADELSRLCRIVRGL